MPPTALASCARPENALIPASGIASTAIGDSHFWGAPSCRHIVEPSCALDDSAITEVRAAQRPSLGDAAPSATRDDQSSWP
jgi:hypothetical protein